MTCASAELEHPVDQRAAVRRLGFDDCLRVRVRDHLTPIAGQPVANSVSTSIRTVTRGSSPHALRVHVEGGVAVEVGRHREVTIGHRKIGDPVDSEAPPGLASASFPTTYQCRRHVPTAQGSSTRAFLR
jgi:hypothetical protein